MQSAHRIREALMRERTALINRIRGLLGEYGVTIAKEAASIRRHLPGVLEDAENSLTFVARRLFSGLYDDLRAVEERDRRSISSFASLAHSMKWSGALRGVPGIGWLSASALFEAVGDAKAFKNGRQLAAWIGLTPRQSSSGGKPRLRNDPRHNQSVRSDDRRQGPYGPPRHCGRSWSEPLLRATGYRSGKEVDVRAVGFRAADHAGEIRLHAHRDNGSREITAIAEQVFAAGDMASWVCLGEVKVCVWSRLQVCSRPGADSPCD